jgi:hypothetical protein
VDELSWRIGRQSGNQFGEERMRKYLNLEHFLAGQVISPDRRLR